MKNWFRQLFCFHRWTFRGELDIETPNGFWIEELHRCEKCGKLRQRVKKD